MVNGKPVKKHFLQANDVIEIGKHKLKYFAEGPSAVAGDDFEKTMIIRSPAKPADAPAERAASGTVTNLRAAVPEAAKAAAPAAPATTAPAAPARVAPAAPAPAVPAAAPAGDNAPLREAAIQVLSGAAAGRTLDITKNLTTIGKPGLQVAVITKRPHGFFITHVEGATYPTLNGASLGATAHPLADHDMIEIAGVKMEFFFKT